MIRIWVLLANLLQPAPTAEHTENTCPSLYLQITIIASALVHNRRDLVAASLSAPRWIVPKVNAEAIGLPCGFGAFVAQR